MPPLRGFSWQKTRLFRYDYVTPAGFKPELIDPADDRGYSKFNRSAVRFMPDFNFSKIRDDSYVTKIKNVRPIVWK